jgi:hypothetical protein
MRVLILAHAGDLTALRVRAMLGARYPEVFVQLAWLHDLTGAARLSHTVEQEGTTTVIRLRDGSDIDGETAATDVLFNRLRYVDVPGFWHASRGDREYAAAEMHALLLSWLTGVRCPVINAASPAGLGGAARHPLEWYLLASAEGLRTPDVTITSSPRRFDARGLHRVDTSQDLGVHLGAASDPLLVNRPGWFREALTDRYADVLVLGSETLGDLPPATRDRAAALVHRAGLVLARCQFQQHAGGEWVFVGVDQWPDLADDQGAALVAELLVREARSHQTPTAGIA